MLELSFLDWASAGAVAANAPASRHPAASKAGKLVFIENSSCRGRQQAYIAFGFAVN
jgi:hypothetical protein